ncbi:MAG: hypothetical protein LBI77_00790 [Puniceicoccales bacterium]|nr:hypothetical protein [Puniceicoccales bacterium]
MDSINHKNDIDNVSRPQGGEINLPEEFLFGVGQTSKTENFAALQQRIGEATQRGETIDDKAIERFLTDIEGKSTTKEELHQAIGITKQLAEHPEILSEAGQSLLMNSIQFIANHRNADYSIPEKTKGTLSELSKHLPVLSAEAQEKFFAAVTSYGTQTQDKEWNLEIAANIANANANGLDDIHGVAKDQYINLFGNMAQDILSLSPKSQAEFQKAAIELMQKTQFPHKFDSDSFREALFSVPEEVRGEKYSSALNQLDQKNLETVPVEAEPPPLDLEEVSSQKDEPLLEKSESQEETVPVEAQLPPFVPENVSSKKYEPLLEESEPQEDLIASEGR